jgi:hypothetical protein
LALTRRRSQSSVEHSSGAVAIAEMGPLPEPDGAGWQPHPTWQQNVYSAAPVPEGPENRKLSRSTIAAATVSALIVVVAAAAGVYALSDDPSSPALPSTAAPAPVETFCPDRAVGATITTSGPGTDTTGPGVIAALDYAYYIERDANRVNSLMVSAPSSVPAIQAAIDAVPTGTRACVTTTPDWSAQTGMSRGCTSGSPPPK